MNSYISDISLEEWGVIIFSEIIQLQSVSVWFVSTVYTYIPEDHSRLYDCLIHIQSSDFSLLLLVELNDIAIVFF
jgi:hypothetical protein